MKRSIIAAGVLGILVFAGCSDDKVSGNAIEPNGIADLSSSSNAEDGTSASYTLDINEIYTFRTPATEQAQLGLVKLSTYMEENAASGSCAVKEQNLSGVVKIKNGLITRAYSGKNLKADINQIVYMFQKSCVYEFNDLEIVADTLSVNDNNFDYVCVAETEYMSIDKVLPRFEQVMSNNCQQLEIQDRLDSLDSANAANSLPNIPLPSDSNNAVIDISVKTLANYALQYARPEDLSFDKHVMAYTGDVSIECFKAVNAFEEFEYGYSIREEAILPISKDAFSICFPETDAVGHFAEKETSCKYYLIQAPDGTQPTAHILNKVSPDSIETVYVSQSRGSSGGCFVAGVGVYTGFLVEDCDGIISENTIVRHREATSGRWTCDGTSNVQAYGEWFSESLLGN
ncbi:MAG: hypothetical protein MJY98_04320 [Fibrobacter sp.]|nr:hypothetical protein [Fibrobacter sp.]